MWKAAVEFEEPEAACILPSHAVECYPKSVDLCFAWVARLKTYENARNVLNKARENISIDQQILTTTAKRKEASGIKHVVDEIIERALTPLSASGVEINVEDWLKKAIEAKKEGDVHCCQVIIKYVIRSRVEEGDKKHTWMEDAQTVIILFIYLYSW